MSSHKKRRALVAVFDRGSNLPQPQLLREVRGDQSWLVLVKVERPSDRPEFKSMWDTRSLKSTGPCSLDHMVSDIVDQIDDLCAGQPPDMGARMEFYIR